MNIKAFTLSIISVAAAVAAANPAQAQDAPRPSARWSFAPNVYKLEQPILPRGYNQPAPSAVRAGAVPTSSMMGVDPGFLKKAPTAPLINTQQSVAAVPIAKPSNPFDAFKAAFGKPISSAPMMAALPQSLPAAPMPSANKAVSARPLLHKPVQASHGVSGKLLTPQHHVGQSARPAALPQVANYGSKFFAPGGFNINGSSQGGATTSVRATLYKNN